MQRYNKIEYIDENEDIFFQEFIFSIYQTNNNDEENILDLKSESNIFSSEKIMILL